ncbi:hypothetical protein Tco_0190556 [Tanacetum coccineum]
MQVRGLKPLEFEVGDVVLLKVSPWKGVVRFRKHGKLSPCYIGPFRILARVGPVAYTLELPKELKGIHSTFHVLNLKKCLAKGDVVVPMDEIQVEDKLHMIEEPVEIVDKEVKRLKQSRIPIVKFKWNERSVPIAEGSSEKTTEGFMKSYKTVSNEIRSQLDAEADAVQIILTRIDNDIYSTVGACPNACEMWKAIERLKLGNSKYNVHSQELKIISYHKLYDILKQHQNEVNELRAERLARTANPLALVAQQQPIYHLFKTLPTRYTHNSSSRQQQATTRNRGKAIRAVHIVVGKGKLYGTLVCSSLGFNCYNYKEYGHIARECQKQKRKKSWIEDDTVCVKMKIRELVRLYLYMPQIHEVSPDVAKNSRLIFDAEPMQKVQNDDDNYNVFASDREHPKQPESINDTYMVMLPLIILS